MITAVTFDFWNTLYGEDSDALAERTDRRTAIVQGFFSAAGRKVTSDDARVTVMAVASTINKLRVEEQRCLGHGEAGEAIAAQLGYQIGYEKAVVLAESISAIVLRHPPSPLDGAGMLLSGLAGKVRLGLISDTALSMGKHLREVMAGHGLADYFDQCTFSDETLTTKPMSRQFLHTLHMLGVTPDQAVHIGDLEKSDIFGAKAVGMRTIRIGETSSPSDADAVAGDLAGAANILRRWGVQIS